MNEPPAVDTILEDIEFELLLSSVPSGELGQAITQLRREQNRIRREYAARRGRVDARQLAGELLGLNDLLLDVLHEVGSRLVRLEAAAARLAGRLPASGDECPPEPGPEPAEVGPFLKGAAPPSPPDLSPGIELDVRPLPLPIAGRLIDRLRLALHRVALYYVRRLAERQAAVNLYQAGEVERLSRVVAEQQRRLAVLESELGRQPGATSADSAGDDTEKGGA